MGKIQDALAKLNPEDATQWTSDGEAKLDTVRTLADTSSVSRQEVNKVAPGFSRTSAAGYSFDPANEPATGASVPWGDSAATAGSTAPAAPETPAAGEPETPASDSASKQAELEEELDPAEKIQAKLAEAKEDLIDALNMRKRAEIAVRDAQAAYDKLVVEESRLAPPQHRQTQMAILENIQHSQKMRSERAGALDALNILARNGVKLDELSRAVKSPLDQALATRKR